MSLTTPWLLAAAIVLATLAMSLPQHAAARRPLAAKSNIQLEGPTRIVVRDLGKASAGGIAAQTPPRIAPPRAPVAGPVPMANVIDAGAGAASAPQAGYGFEGLSNSDNMDVTGLDLSQPDPQVAVNADYVVEFVNVLGRVFDRGGLPLQMFKVTDFFGVPATHFTFNSRVIYDAPTGRWFATTGSYSTDTAGPDDGGMHIAVSNTSDPLGEWSVYHTYFSDMFPDLPAIGLTDDKVTVSSALYDIQAVVSGGTGACHSYCGEQTIVFQKSDLLAGVPAADVNSYAFPIRPDRFSVRPAQSLSAVNDQYLGMFSTADRSYLDIIRITGTPAVGNVAEAGMTELLILTQLDPPPSITAGIGNCYVFGQNLGPPPCIDSGDYRLLETVWRDNKMWLAAPAACRPLHDDTPRSCAHLIEVDTSGTPTKTQDMMFGAAGEYYSWPAIRTNNAGDLVVVLSHTSPSIFAEVRVSGRKATDNPNTMEGSTLLRVGEVSVTSGRWGDYFGAAVDPTDSDCIWVAGEFAKSTRGRDWSTYIASTGYDAGCLVAPTPTPSPTATPSSTPAPSVTIAPSVTPTASATPTPLPRAGDVDCTALVDSLDAALVLQFSGGLITSLACQPGADVNHDGSIDALDAALILQFSAGLIAQLPA